MSEPVRYTLDDFTWWADRDGRSHLAPNGSVLGVCGAHSLRVRVGRGVPCERCMTTVADWIANGRPPVRMVPTECGVPMFSIPGLPSDLEQRS